VQRCKLVSVSFRETSRHTVRPRRHSGRVTIAIVLLLIAAAVAIAQAQAPRQSTGPIYFMSHGVIDAALSQRKVIVVLGDIVR
jgi:hypothetical protein